MLVRVVGSSTLKFLSDFDLEVCFSSAVGFSQVVYGKYGPLQSLSAPVRAAMGKSPRLHSLCHSWQRAAATSGLYSCARYTHPFRYLVQPRVGKVEETAQLVRFGLSSTSTNPALFSPEESDS